MRSWLGFLTPNLTTSYLVFKAIRLSRTLLISILQCNHYKRPHRDQAASDKCGSPCEGPSTDWSTAPWVQVPAQPVAVCAHPLGRCPGLSVPPSPPGRGGDSACSQACCDQCPVVSSAGRSAGRRLACSRLPSMLAFCPLPRVRGQSHDGLCTRRTGVRRAHLCDTVACQKGRTHSTFSFFQICGHWFRFLFRC